MRRPPKKEPIFWSIPSTWSPADFDSRRAVTLPRGVAEKSIGIAMSAHFSKFDLKTGVSAPAEGGGG